MKMHLARWEGGRSGPNAVNDEDESSKGHRYATRSPSKKLELPKDSLSRRLRRAPHISSSILFTFNFFLCTLPHPAFKRARQPPNLRFALPHRAGGWLRGESERGTESRDRTVCRSHTVTPSSTRQLFASIYEGEYWLTSRKKVLTRRSIGSTTSLRLTHPTIAKIVRKRVKNCEGR